MTQQANINNVKIQLLNERLDVLESLLKRLCKQQGIPCKTWDWMPAHETGLTSEQLKSVRRSTTTGTRMYYRPDVVKLQ